MVHALTDGRDTPPQSAAEYLNKFTSALPSSVPVATVVGRYYGMDRDKRWERVVRAYDAIVSAEGPRFADPQAAIADAYAHKLYDEFIVPAVIGDYRGMKDDDGVLCFNFRADRVREIFSAMLEPAFSGFPRKRIVRFAAAVGMAQYSDALDKLMETIFPPQTFPNILGEVVANADRTQLRMAETEKYPHVTYFLNGGREEPFLGEDRIMVPSPKVATYDLQPEMSAPELTAKAVEAIESRKYDLIVLNFANAGHGRPYRQPAGGDQGGGDGRYQPRQDRRRDQESGRRAARHRRPRQLRNDARSGDGRPAHRAHHQSGAAHSLRRRQPPAAGGGTAGGYRPDFTGVDGPAQAGGNDRRVAVAFVSNAALAGTPAIGHSFAAPIADAWRILLPIRAAPNRQTMATTRRTADTAAFKMSLFLGMT